ncbi:MAG TPA: DUF3604 domain-containing protein [Candidatus Kryptonia bacterium]|nr:DUF3604 domain-containing protein [Candidatus Kryptonia bacterium]
MASEAHMDGSRARCGIAAAIMLGIAGCGGTVAAPQPSASAPPWQRTEVREPCAEYDPQRTPYFGDLHIHTLYSADAYIFGTRGDPRDAYAFARGAAIAVSDDNEAQTRMARLDRPLDFAAVTDHAEFFGEVQLCSTPTSAVFDQSICALLRRSDTPEAQSAVRIQWLAPLNLLSPPKSLDFCSTPGVDCDAAAVSVWQEIQAAAEAAYDRTAACSFTTFIGYEHTTSPGGRHLHRNIIFRNHHVPAFASSHLETAQFGVPQGIWTAVERDCLQAGTGCDAVIIPHNSNLSGGLQWLDPADANEAQRRQNLEPLVEIHQIKGNSECRYDRVAQAGAGTADELCTFEQDPRADEFPLEQPPPIDMYPSRNMVRNTLKDGLLFEQRLGVNPFKLGFVGGTDTHNATAGNVAEIGWTGGQGNNDSSPARQIGSEIRTNPGGLTVVWAEENSRDAIFAALKRRETYATSGTRPAVRFFAGDYAGLTCDSADLIQQAYARGTPMGGDWTPRRNGAAPNFLVWAMKDAGTTAAPGADLQRIQIVKGWVDGDGQTHEQVFDVAGSADTQATVDPATCDPAGEGFRELCEIWTDPTFDPTQSAFYYARVLENPSCRWSTRVCKSVGVDPFASDCVAQATAAGRDFANCCLNQTTDAFMEPVIQERAWTSPIWYRAPAGGRS